MRAIHRGWPWRGLFIPGGRRFVGPRGGGKDVVSPHNPLVFVEVSKLLSNTAVIGAEKAQRLMALVLSVEASASSTKGAATSHDVRGRGPQFRWASLASSA